MSTEWTPDLTLNHQDLDADHVELFRKLAAAAAAVGVSARALTDAMELLSEAFLAHVAREDALMAGSGYPEREAHRSAHDFFLAALARVGAAVAGRGPSADEVDWLQARAPEWLRFHVRVNDAPLVAWLARRRERAMAIEDLSRGRS
jgi:hemerythrin-like metal-binding protein